MHGSNNEVAVLEAVLGSLSKSEAFGLFETVEVPAPVPVISDDMSGFLALIQNMDNEQVVSIAGGLFHEQATLIISETEAVSVVSAHLQRMEETEIQMLEFSEAETKHLTLTASESAQMNELDRRLGL